MKLALMSTLFLSTLCYGFEINEKIINSLTREIYYRYYLIKRCQQPIRILINHQELWKRIHFEKLSADQVDNAEIKQAIHQLQTSHDVASFIQLWHEMNTHRNVRDPVFHKDFVKLLFMLFASLETSSRIKEIEISDVNNFNTSIEKMLMFIDKNIDKLYLPHNRPKQQYHKFADQKQVTTDEIALNYYLIQRLDKAIETLSAAQFQPFELAQKNGTAVDYSIENSFSHERVSDCFSQMLIQKNLTPLLHMWEEFIHFRHAGDSLFFKEMLMMLFTVYKELLFAKLQQESETIITTEMNTILDLYEHIDELPLDEILKAIDLTTDKLVLLQNIEKKKTDNWRLQRFPIIFHTLLALPLAYILIKTCTL